MEYQGSFGRFFEEFSVGDVFKHWPGRTVTQSDNIMFSLLTMNQHPLHIDENYGKQTQFSKNLVVGTLVFSIVVGMSVADISGKAIANLEYEKVTHLGPVFHGDTLYAETTVLGKKESASKPDRGVIYVETQGFNQSHDLVLTFRRKVLIPKNTPE